MHSRVSDGIDTPQELLLHVKEAGIGIFSLTDHDAVKGCSVIRRLLDAGSPRFICGVEFSCKDEEGKYHILGYGCDPDSVPVQRVVSRGHMLRIRKVMARLDFLKKEFGFSFDPRDIADLMAMDNPGKPHIGNLMVRYGYAETKEKAIKQYINKLHFGSEYVTPKEAIEGVLGSGGIPVLAHPAYGNGDQLILGEELSERVERLIGYGLKGVEGFYSGFTGKIRAQVLSIAENKGLYVTAGSDYHGSNKLVQLGDTGLDSAGAYPAALDRFLEDVRYMM